MTKEAFIEFIQQQEFLGKERQDDLLQNAGWITAPERALLMSEIEKAKGSIEQNNKTIIDELNKIEEAVKTFHKEELPKLVKAEEKTEHESDEEQAEHLLQNL